MTDLFFRGFAYLENQRRWKNLNYKYQMRCAILAHQAHRRDGTNERH